MEGPVRETGDRVELRVSRIEKRVENPETGDGAFSVALIWNGCVFGPGLAWSS